MKFVLLENCLRRAPILSFTKKQQKLQSLIPAHTGTDTWTWSPYKVLFFLLRKERLEIRLKTLHWRHESKSH